MKTKIFKAGVAMSLCIAALATSCSDKIAEDYAPNGKQVPLEVTVAGINDTRSLITGTTLPDSCDFAIFYKSPYSVKVDYRNELCTPQSPIILEDNQTDDPVYAVYPYEPGIEVEINTSESQIDYLRGISVDDNGAVFYPYADKPQAKLLFDHVLSRITVNIHKDSTIDKVFKFSDIFVGGDDEKAYRNAIYLPNSNDFEFNIHSNFGDIKGELKDGKYWLETEKDVITVDFLVLPTETTWMLNIKDLSEDWYPLPATKYESGKQYIYDCTIVGEESIFLSITECNIVQWDKLEMPEVETY